MSAIMSARDRPPLFLERHPAIHHPRQALLAVADDEQVDERRQQFGILSAGAAGDDERMIERAILAVQRHAAEIEHRQDVRVADLVLQAETEQIEVLQRRVRLQAVERQPVVAQHFLEIEPRREGAFAGPLRVVVHDRIKHLQTVMARAQRIGVGERQAEFAAHLAMILDDAVEFAADVLGRHLHARQDAVNGLLERRIHHEESLVALGDYSFSRSAKMSRIGSWKPGNTSPPSSVWSSVSTTD